MHSRTASVVKRVITKSNIEKLQTELKLINWNDLTKSDDPEESFNTFDEVFMKLYNSCIPEKKYASKKKRKMKRNSTRIKNKLYKKCLEKPNSELYEKYKYYRNKLNRLKKILKKTYYERKFENIKGDLKQTWKLINDLTKRNKQESVKETEFNNNNNNK